MNTERPKARKETHESMMKGKKGNASFRTACQAAPVESSLRSTAGMLKVFLCLDLRLAEKRTKGGPSGIEPEPAALERRPCYQLDYLTISAKRRFLTSLQTPLFALAPLRKAAKIDSP